MLNSPMGLQIKSFIRNFPKVSCKKVKQHLKAMNGEEISIPSESTILRFLKSQGYDSKQMSYQPILRPINIKKRLEFAQWVPQPK